MSTWLGCFVALAHLFNAILLYVRIYISNFSILWRYFLALRAFSFKFKSPLIQHFYIAAMHFQSKNAQVGISQFRILLKSQFNSLFETWAGFTERGLREGVLSYAAKSFLRDIDYGTVESRRSLFATIGTIVRLLEWSRAFALLLTRAVQATHFIYSLDTWQVVDLVTVSLLQRQRWLERITWLKHFSHGRPLFLDDMAINLSSMSGKKVVLVQD